MSADITPVPGVQADVANINGVKEVEDDGQSNDVNINGVKEAEDDGKVVFPPPNSWYRPHVATSREDMWAYIGLNLVVVVRPRKNTGQKSFLVPNGNSEAEEIHRPETDGGLWPEFIMVGIQRDKYSSISFCQAKYEDLPLGNATLVTGCEGGFVRLWDVSKNATLAFHDNHKKVPVCGVEWSPRNYSVVYSVDEEGCLTMWNLKRNSLLSMSFGKMNPTCLSVSPSEDNIIALGTKSGNIVIIETVGNGKILHKMRHEEEVITVRWKIDGNWETLNSLNQQSNKKNILVSSIFSVKPATIRVWDRQGKDVAILGVWDKEHKDQYSHRKITKYFNTSCWAKDPNTGNLMLVTAGRQGEIIAYSEGNVPNEIHRLHTNSFVFGIIQFRDILWTLSYEPIIVGWNLRTNQVECVIPTFRGIASLMCSPVEGTRVVVGGVDSYIRVLSLQNGYPDLVSIKPPTVTHRLKGKISAVAWHPNRENKIGFGTDEGVLGVYEWKEDNKFAVLFNRRVSGTVYTVDWGPPCYSEVSGGPEGLEGTQDKSKDTFMLYCCGGQSVFMIHPSRHTNSLVSVSKIIERSNPDGQGRISVQDKASEIRWSPDRSFLAVGYADGRIELYAPPHLKMKCWIKCHGRAIQFFSWRTFDFLDEQRDTRDRWFASASNDGTTRLFNLEELFRKETERDEPLQIISSAATLQGHQGLRVIWLSWSPHDKDLLVTCSYDRTAIVWNIKDGSKIARYMEHQHRLVACMFHPADPYKVISCSDELSLDFTVHVWDYRKHPNIHPVPKQILSVAKSDPVKAVKENSSSEAEVSDDGFKSKAITGSGHIVQLPDKKFVMLHPKSEEKVKSKMKAKSRTLLPSTSNGLINAKFSLNHEIRYIVDKTKIPIKVKESTAQEVELERSLPKVPQDVEDSITEIVSSASSSKDAQAHEDENPTLHLGILGSAEECKQLVSSEMKLHREKDNWKAMLQLSEWMGNSSVMIREAIAAGQINETIISSAAAVSKKLYLETIEAYIPQLIESEEFYKAAHYFLLSNQLEKALDLLISKKMFRDAAAIAKLRLPPSDPLLVQVNEKWIYQMMCDGNFELATKIYCSMNRYSEALTTIEKRNLPYAWKAGVYIAAKDNDTKKVEMLGIKYILDSLSKGFYDECLDLIKEFAPLQCMMAVVVVHQCLHEAESSLNAVSNSEDLSLWNEAMADFGEEVKESWESHGIDASNEGLQKKIKNVLQLAIPQSDTEAQQIIVKNIVLILMDDEDRIARALECYSLAKLWCEEKDTSLFCTVVTCVSNLLPEWIKNKETVPVSVSMCQSTANLYGAFFLLKKIKTEGNEERMKIFVEAFVEPAIIGATKLLGYVDSSCKDKIFLSCSASIDKLVKDIELETSKSAVDNSKSINGDVKDDPLPLPSAGDSTVPLLPICENGSSSGDC